MSGKFDESISKAKSAAAIPGPAAQLAVNNLSDSLSSAAQNAGPHVDRIVKSIANFPEFQWHYIDNICWRIKINNLYKTILYERAETAPKIDWFGPFGRTGDELNEKADGLVADEIYIFAAEQVYRKKFAEAQNALMGCIGENDAVARESVPKPPDRTPLGDPNRIVISPFDRRVDKLAQDAIGGDPEIRIPFNTAHQRISTTGYIASDKALEEQYNAVSGKDKIIEAIGRTKSKMRSDDYYLGVDSMINPYAVTRLYGSKGGEFLLDQKNQRRWYEIDQTSANADFTNYSKMPTTTSIINWGNADPYGRTPYHFTDFAFCKNWNIIQNNRMITLRRFAAPILDNLKFPGIEGTSIDDNPSENTGEGNTVLGVDGTSQSSDSNLASAVPGSSGDESNSKPSAFPPMATAVTYFGDDTGNNLSDLLKFSTGMNWDEVKADLHTPSPASTPGADNGAGGLSHSLTKYAKMFNVATGNFNNSAILNKGVAPPDPYIDGPYENRIIGPVNRIQAVKKRAPGLTYENPLDLTFEYVARPIGGINLKAALLEVLSNFLVIGSASAVFWGGQHRFMGDPIKYPFIGGEKGMQEWYKGNPVGWGKETIHSFTTGVSDIGPGIANFFKTLLSAGSGGDIFGGISNLFNKGSIGGNALKAAVAEKSAGQIPYLQGMKALLIGEPVGEWHVTIGNPFNPIAMIGNLICTGIDVELGNELGPDDFPLDMKIVVHLDHGMARDKDAIQSIFNRGMGRIYDLPDDFKGSADFTTAVDNKTKDQDRSVTGSQPTYYKVPIGGQGTQVGNYSKPAISDNALGGSVSIWNRGNFSAISNNQVLDFSRDQVLHNRSAFRSGEWIGLKSVK